jgi:photosystem II stability/assembly factor-like uncharacterized protein
MFLASACALFYAVTLPAIGQDEPAATAATDAAPPSIGPPAVALDAGTYGALRFRALGPALTSGRVGDFAVNPGDPSEYYVAVCSGGVWKTTDGGVTYDPIFDDQASYSIGCLRMDPNNPHVIWVGTGENNSQRSVSFGDGVYRSRNGGKSWDHMGLRDSEHIGMIQVDPRDSDVVYVAAQGPLWRGGGDRGLYKTVDGGATWDRVLHVSDDTGINEVHMDPRNPDVLYASAYQRRRRVWTLINGGPESAIYKSTDAGATWRKITSGVPGGDKGRIGLAISPVDPDYLYAIIEAQGTAGGLFRSTDRGETWTRRSTYMTSSPQYYNELVPSPHDRDTLYALDTRLQRSIDGGASFQRVPGTRRHVDDHALWIDPADAEHLLVGCDGGIYESWNAGGAWLYKPNLSITQFYRVAVDNSEPFYFVYGGTQDNNTLGGPSETTNSGGISNEDWFVTVGGDGFEPAIDPEDPNIVYSQWQYGGLVRYDRRSGEQVDIKPREQRGEAGYVWNWDSPLIISPHDPHRLYFGANILFRSDDRGDSWRQVSGDLTRQLDRNELEVMGRIQPVDAVSKHRSTSIWGNLVALSESPLQEGLIYAGTDDGLIQVTEDGGENWRRIDLVPGVPDMTYVSAVLASGRDVDTVYASFDNHKSGDFTPYVLRSDDRGATWHPISGDLPERDVVYTLAEDHEADLLFCGTEFGAYFTIDGGEHWLELGGMPTIAVRDLDIQRRENDLVAATFGRGFYVLDDYSPLRHVAGEALTRDAHMFPIAPAKQFARSRRGRGSQGATFFTTPNPPYGATFTYNLAAAPKTALQRASAGNEDYPTADDERAKERDIKAVVVLTVRDESGEVVRRLKAGGSKGMNRTTWDLRSDSVAPVSGRDRGQVSSGGAGPEAAPGTYTVEVSTLVDGELTVMTEPASFDIVSLGLSTFASDAHAEVLAFRRDVAELSAAVRATRTAIDDAGQRLGALRQAVFQSPDLDTALLREVGAIEIALADLRLEMSGDSIGSRRQEPQPRTLTARANSLMGQWNVTSAPTQTQRTDYAIASEVLADLLPHVRSIVEERLPALAAKVEAAGGPLTPGRLPAWPPRDR